MADLVEDQTYPAGIYQIETVDPVEGGVGGISNRQALALAKRTAWLKLQQEQHAAAGDPHPQYMTAAESNAVIADAVAALVASSPAVLDTLNELATALGNDPNFAATITTDLAAKTPLAVTDAIIQAAGLTVDHNNTAQLLEAIQRLTATDKNIVVNGGSEISQINGATLVTPATGTWPIDNVFFQSTQASKLQSLQVTNQLNSLGATHAAAWSVLAQYAPVLTDAISESRPIEGINFARLFYGTANAKVASLQFKVNVPAGTYSGAIQNYAKTRSYPFSFVVSAADVTAGGKLVKVENIPGDTAGTWVGATNAGAAYITFDLGSGANFKGTANAWATADYRGVTGASNLVSQVNATVMAITDVQFEQSPFCTRFERKLGDQVQRECQRYLPVVKTTPGSFITFGQAVSPVLAYGDIHWPVPARVPTTGFVLIGGNAVFLTATSPSAGGTISFSGAHGVNGITVQSSGASGLVAGNTSGLLADTGLSLIYGTGAQI